MNEKVEHIATLKSKLPCVSSFPKRKFTWLTNEEIAAILVANEKHSEWFTRIRVQKPENGLVFLFNRKEVKYRQDKYTWKTKRKSKFLREDRMKLKIGGVPYITATYVHSDILPTFHRRSYWLLQNPDIVLVHYLNYPYLEDDNHVVRDFCLNRHCNQWRDLSREEIYVQLLPMFSQMPWPRQNSCSLTQKGKEIIVSYLLEQHFSERDSKAPHRPVNRNGYIQPKIPNSGKLLPFKLIDGSTTSSQPSLTLLTDQICVTNIQPLEVVSVPLVTQPPSLNDTEASTIVLNKGQNILMSSTPTTNGLMNTSDLMTSYQPISKLAPDSNLQTFLSNDDVVLNNSNHNKLVEDKIESDVETTNAVNNLISNSRSNIQQQQQNLVETTSSRLDLEEAKSKLIGDHTPFASETLFDIEDISASTDLSSSLLNGDTIFNQVLPNSSNSSTNDDWDLLGFESCLNNAATFEDVTCHDQLDEMIDISDYSPDWAYTEGGIKVLLIGNWTRSGNYKCVFDQTIVEAMKLQNGVLRCYCPDLHVTYNGFIVSRKVSFEYKPLPSPYRDISSQWLMLKDNEFKLSILERLESVENRLNSFGSNHVNNRCDSNGLFQATNGGASCSTSVDDIIQQQMLLLCCRINKLVSENRHYNSDILDNLSSSNQTSLIHIACGLGYIKLIQLVQQLWFDGSNYFLENQCNPTRMDIFNQTPLMWASGAGFLDCAEMLWQWNGQVDTTDVIGRTAAGIAAANGHQHIADRLTSLPRTPLIRDDGTSFGELAPFLNPAPLFVVLFATETSSQDSGEFSMSTDNDLSLTDYEGTLQPSQMMMDDIKHTTNNCHFPFNDLINDNRNLADLAEQVIRASETKMSFPDSGLRQIQICFQLIQPKVLESSNRADWINFVLLPPPNNHLAPRFLDLQALCLTDNEKTHLLAASETFLQRLHSHQMDSGGDDRESLIIKYCYSKYTEFKAVKRMNEAAVLIQSKFRSYQEQKRFQRSRHAAILIQSSYRNYKSTGKYLNNIRLCLAKKQQNQAARKIQRFLRRCRYRLQEKSC